MSQTLPLSGIRIADFSRLLPGPWAANVLGSLGAQVIKVETPGTGDPSRHNPPFYESCLSDEKESVYFDSMNCNKRSIAIDLKQEAGLQIAERLIASSDVLIESFRPGVADKLRIGYKRVRKLNAGIIYCALSGFGNTGPLSHVPGHDLMVQALSGLMGIEGRESACSEIPEFQAADYAAAVFACMGIMSALMIPKEKRKSCYLDISMLDSLFALTGIIQTGSLARRAGNSGKPLLQAWGRNPRYNTYATADGRTVTACLLEKASWQKFCRYIDRMDLVCENEGLSDRHSDHGGMGERYRAAISEYCAGKSLAEHLAIMHEKGLPIAPVLTPDEALASDIIADRNMVSDINQTEKKRSRCRINDPLIQSGLAVKSVTPAPGLSEQSGQILNELGFNTDEQHQLREQGVIT